MLSLRGSLHLSAIGTAVPKIRKEGKGEMSVQVDAIQVRHIVRAIDLRDLWSLTAEEMEIAEMLGIITIDRQLGQHQGSWLVKQRFAPVEEL